MATMSIMLQVPFTKYCVSLQELIIKAVYIGNIERKIQANDLSLSLVIKTAKASKTLRELHNQIK